MGDQNPILNHSLLINGTICLARNPWRPLGRFFSNVHSPLHAFPPDQSLEAGFSISQSRNPWGWYWTHSMLGAFFLKSSFMRLGCGWGVGPGWAPGWVLDTEIPGPGWHPRCPRCPRKSGWLINTTSLHHCMQRRTVRRTQFWRKFRGRSAFNIVRFWEPVAADFYTIVSIVESGKASEPSPNLQWTSGLRTSCPDRRFVGIWVCVKTYYHQS